MRAAAKISPSLRNRQSAKRVSCPVSAATIPAAPQWRLSVLVAIVVVHLALLALLTKSRLPRPPAPAAALTIVAVPAASPAVPPPPLPERPLDAGIVPPPIEIAALPSRVARTCDLLEGVRTAMQADAAAVAALTEVAAGSRTLMAWNGRWSELVAATQVRPAVTSALATADAACLDAPVIGPRLVFVTASGAGVSVAFGSGDWHWRDLLTDR